MSDGDLVQEYDNAVGDSDDHLAGLRAVERAARVSGAPCSIQVVASTTGRGA